MIRGQEMFLFSENLACFVFCDTRYEIVSIVLLPKIRFLDIIINHFMFRSSILKN